MITVKPFPVPLLYQLKLRHPGGGFLTQKDVKQEWEEALKKGKALCPAGGNGKWVEFPKAGQ